MDFKKEFESLNRENVFLIVEDKIKERVTTLKSKYELKNKELYIFKIITISEFIDLLSFKVDKEAYLYNLEVLERPLAITKEMFKFAKCNLNNINEDLNSFIKENEKFINKNQNFIANIKKYDFYILGNDVFLQPFKQKYGFNLIPFPIYETKKTAALIFNTKEEEVFYVFEKIAKFLDEKVDINDIYIANIDSSYYSIIKKLSSFYKIPVNLNEKISLYNIPYIKNILNGKYEDIISVLSNPKLLYKEYEKEIENDEEAFKSNINKLVNIFNSYRYSEYSPSNVLKIINEETKNININNKKTKNSIKVIDIEEIVALDSSAKVFVLNTTYESFPRILKDNDLISNKEKEKLNYPVSSDVNYRNNEYLEKIIKKDIIMYISFSKRDNYAEFTASDITLKLLNKNEEVTKIGLRDLSKGYAVDYYRSFFSNNDSNNNLQTIFKGDFKLEQDEKEELKKALEKKTLKLSPTSLNIYFELPFIYYLKKILGLENYTKSVSLNMGNFFHAIARGLLLIQYKEKLDDKTVKYEMEIVKDENVNKEIIDYINKKSFEGKEYLDLYFDEFFEIYSKYEKNSKDLDLSIKTLFYIKKNKPEILQALKIIDNLEKDIPSKKLLIEAEIESDYLEGKSDLIKIYSDNKYSIIDYKKSKIKAMNKNNLKELIDALLNDSNEISFEVLKQLQLFLYSYIFYKNSKDLELKDVAYFSYLDEKKLNGISVEQQLNDIYYTSPMSEDRILDKEELRELFNKIDKLIEQTLKKIYNFEFPIKIVKDLKTKEGKDETYYSQYEALAFYNNNNNNEIEEDSDAD